MRKRISRSEPVSALRHVPIVECGEPLVPVREALPELLIDSPRFRYERVWFARESVIEMLRAAAASMPPGFRLALVEAWRPPHIQRRMNLFARARIREAHPDWPEATIARVANRYSAPPSKVVPPPHSTGGAVDVALCDAQGTPVDVTSPFERRDRRVYGAVVRGLSAEALRHRSILFEAMGATGLTNYPSEYWHWSYGDQGWAYRGDHPHALYGAVSPAGYSVPPDEDVPDPLEWIAE